MSNLGLGNRAELKAQLLAPSLVAETDLNGVIDAVGLGVAGLLETACNRKFERTVAAQDIFTADRKTWILQRYPIETVSAIEQRDDLAGGWTTLVVNDTIANQLDLAGLLFFASLLGTELSQIRVTYTGGYWFDMTEDSTGVMPGAATLLPKDLRMAWYLQCREVWNKIDRLGTGIVSGENATFVSQMLMNLDLLPAVKGLLQKYVRYQMT